MSGFSAPARASFRSCRARVFDPASARECSRDHDLALPILPRRAAATNDRPRGRPDRQLDRFARRAPLYHAAAAGPAAGELPRQVALHRPLGGTPFTQPEIWLARSADMIHWGRHEVLRASVAAWDAGRVGAGAPPIRTPDGWLEIYHGSAKPVGDSGVGSYSAGALLLDLHEPHRIVRQASQPILVPEADFEQEGFVPNVVFPTGVIDRGDTLLVYYGAADTVSAVAELSKADVLAAMR